MPQISASVVGALRAPTALLKPGASNGLAFIRGLKTQVPKPAILEIPRMMALSSYCTRASRSSDFHDTTTASEARFYSSSTLGSAGVHHHQQVFSSKISLLRRYPWINPKNTVALMMVLAVPIFGTGYYYLTNDKKNSNHVVRTVLLAFRGSPEVREILGSGIRIPGWAHPISGHVAFFSSRYDFEFDLIGSKNVRAHVRISLEASPISRLYWQVRSLIMETDAKVYAGDIDEKKNVVVFEK